MGDIFTFGADVPADHVAEGARNIGEVLRRRAAKSPDRPAFFEKTADGWRRGNWSESYDRARRVAQGLVDLGLEVGEVIAILGPTQLEWGLEDLGGHLAGLVTLGIYPLQAAEQVRYLLEHSETRVIFVANEIELETVLEATAGNDHVKAIVPWTEELYEDFKARDSRVMSPSLFRGEPIAEEVMDQRLAEVTPESLAILIYTSGTTGRPKGAMINHANILALMASQKEIYEAKENDVFLSFLPMAHVTERNLAFYCRLNSGGATAYATSIGTVLNDLQDVRPTVFGGVPRIFEKAYARIQSEMAKKPAPVRALFAWATDVARRRFAYIDMGNKEAPGHPPLMLDLQYKLAHRLVFQKIHDIFGGRIRFFIVGAAPVSYEILEFFWAIGLPMFEGYGMTEATVITHVTTEKAYRLGTVGRPIPPLEHKVAEDGEVLIRGPFVFQGYLKNEEATRETVVDGWLHSGDIGVIDEDGYLRITDRKKHLIVTAGGKNVAPANIERAVKEKSPLISQVHAHGDKRPYICAIVAPSPIETLEWGVEKGLVSAEELAERTQELIANPSGRSDALNEAMGRVVADKRFQELFVDPVKAGNRELARVERIRRFVVLDRDFSQEGGELTPTMKTKRKAIEEKYQATFERVYDDPEFSWNVEEAG